MVYQTNFIKQDHKTIMEKINGMFCVSYQIIKNHLELEELHIHFMSPTLASALDIGQELSS